MLLGKGSFDESKRTWKTSSLRNGNMEAVAAWVGIGRMHKTDLF